jgi:hypothetical protein
MASLLEALADRDINLRAIGLSDNGRRTMAVLVSNDDPARCAVLHTRHTHL